MSRRPLASGRASRLFLSSLPARGRRDRAGDAPLLKTARGRDCEVQRVLDVQILVNDIHAVLGDRGYAETAFYYVALVDAVKLALLILENRGVRARALEESDV